MMKVSLNWLNEYIDTPVEADEFERLLTDQGFPIESEHRHSAGDVVMDVEVTSNRPDCLSHLGIAREVVAGSGTGARRLLPPNFEFSADQTHVKTLARIQNDAPDLCSVYTARVIRDVEVGPSPAWIVQRLESVGLRTVNNVVDVTNYVLFEMGQPLHAFDLGRVADRRIIVRRARQDEPFAAIDASRHMLGAGMLAISDGRQAVAVAGVMGGLDTEVGSHTKEVLLESAMFDPLSVRRTSRALKLASDSSYRFERGVDPVGVEFASRRAAKLISQLAGGKIAEGVIRVGMAPLTPPKVGMRVARCQSVLGIVLQASTMLDLLKSLGLSPIFEDQGRVISCTIPSCRLDLHREIDLIEEVGRLHGLAPIGVRQRIEIVARAPQPAVVARRALGEVLVAHGYHEAITFAFLKSKQGGPFVPEKEQPVLVDDQSRRVGTKAEPMLRPSLIPSLLLCRKLNQDAGNTGLRLFEVAATWSGRDGQIVERQRLALLADPSQEGDLEGMEQALRQLCGTLDEVVTRVAGHAILTRVPVPVSNLISAARLELHSKEIGILGVVGVSVADSFGLKGPVVVAELDVDQLLQCYPPSSRVSHLARFPAIERDLSVVVDEKVRWEQIESHIIAAQPTMFEALKFLMIFRGRPVPTGHKSVSFRMVFRDPDATLRRDVVESEVDKVAKCLYAKLGAQLRQ